MSSQDKVCFMSWHLPEWSDIDRNLFYNINFWFGYVLIEVGILQVKLKVFRKYQRSDYYYRAQNNILSWVTHFWISIWPNKVQFGRINFIAHFQWGNHWQFVIMLLSPIYGHQTFPFELYVSYLILAKHTFYWNTPLLINNNVCI